MADQKTYVVKKDGFIHGTWYNHNSHIPLTEEQATIFLREGRIALKEEPKAEARTEVRSEPVREAKA